jgi:hypothetical protein
MIISFLKMEMASSSEKLVLPDHRHNKEEYFTIRLLQLALRGTRYRSWLHYATSRKVAGSIPDEVTGLVS